MVTNPLFVRVFLYLQMIGLEICNGFSKSCLCFQRIKMKRSLTRRLMTGSAVDSPDHVFVSSITSVLPLKLYEKHLRI